jgi:hypothetical protein
MNIHFFIPPFKKLTIWESLCIMNIRITCIPEKLIKGMNVESYEWHTDYSFLIRNIRDIVKTFDITYFKAGLIL